VKTILWRLFKGYICIGAVLAAIMYATFLWSIGWGAPAGMGFMAQLWANLKLEPSFLFASFIRGVFWLPALVIWMIYPGQYTFGMWLAPGLYVETYTPQ
jgi:hypothetical protein